MKKLTLAAIAATLMIVPAAAEEAEWYLWPSQRGEGVDHGDAPPMGVGGECRHEGERIAQGETICIEAGGERYRALCGMALNNTSWLRQSGACPG